MVSIEEVEQWTDWWDACSHYRNVLLKAIIPICQQRSFLGIGTRTYLAQIAIVTELSIRSQYPPIRQACIASNCTHRSSPYLRGQREDLFSLQSKYRHYGRVSYRECNRGRRQIYKNPNPRRMHKAIFVRRFICKSLMMRMGKVERTKAEKTEQAVME